MVWCSFKVPLGEFTFAEHMDRIGQTPEAKELLEGSRSKINPLVDEATDRMLGEYIEAPTSEQVFAPTAATPVRDSAGPPKARKRKPKAHEPSTFDRTKLPGTPVAGQLADQ